MEQAPRQGPAAGGTLPRMVEVTDGWYRTRAALDGPLVQMLERGKLQPGAVLHACTE